VVYPRHLKSFPLFGTEAHGFWTAKEDVEPRLFVLTSYAAGEDSGEVAGRYMQGTEFADDIRNFNVRHRWRRINDSHTFIKLSAQVTGRKKNK
jgi:hypothetical protein